MGARSGLADRRSLRRPSGPPPACFWPHHPTPRHGVRRHDEGRRRASPARSQPSRRVQRTVLDGTEPARRRRGRPRVPDGYQATCNVQPWFVPVARQTELIRHDIARSRPAKDWRALRAAFRPHMAESWDPRSRPGCTRHADSTERLAAFAGATIGCLGLRGRRRGWVPPLLPVGARRSVRRG